MINKYKDYSEIVDIKYNIIRGLVNCDRTYYNIIVIEWLITCFGVDIDSLTIVVENRFVSLYLFIDFYFRLYVIRLLLSNIRISFLFFENRQYSYWCVYILLDSYK